MRYALAVAAKDLRQRLRDRSALLMAFIAPSVLAAIIGVALGGLTSGEFSATYAVADRDGGPLAQGFVSGVLQAPGLRERITLREAASEQEARELVRAGEADAAFLIPAGFSSSVQQGRPGTITVLRAGDSVPGQLAQALAEGYAARLTAVQLAVATALAARGGEPGGEEAARLAERAAAAPPPVELGEEGAGGGEVEQVNYWGPSMGVFFLFFTIGIGARSLLVERRQGTLNRLLASAAPPVAVLAGKALASYALGVAALVTVWLATSLAFQAPWGDPPAVLALILTTALAVTGLTALVVTLARTDEQADGYSTITALVLAVLGGNFVPASELPELLQDLSLLTPNGWALQGFLDLAAGGGGLGTAALPLACTAAFGLVTGMIALVRARRMVAT